VYHNPERQSKGMKI